MLRLAALYGDSNVGHRRGVGSAVPVVFAGGDDGDIALAYHHGFVTGCHGAGAVGNDEDLVTAVLVELVTYTGADARCRS